LLVREHFVMLLVLLRNPLRFHAFLLLLLPSFDGPLLGEMHFADFGLAPFVFSPRHSYFFELDFFADESSFLSIDIRVELSQPGISQDNAILPQIGDIELLGDLLFPSLYMENAGLANDPSLIFCPIHIVHLVGSPQVFGIEPLSYCSPIVNEVFHCATVN
jgi:hypothetical protein